MVVGIITGWEGERLYSHVFFLDDWQVSQMIFSQIGP